MTLETFAINPRRSVLGWGWNRSISIWPSIDTGISIAIDVIYINQLGLSHSLCFDDRFAAFVQHIYRLSTDGEATQIFIEVFYFGKETLKFSSVQLD